MTGPARPLIASDDWMHEQQLRAELEAEAWRRLRMELAEPPAPAPPPQPEPATAQIDPHSTGSTLLKALVRFALGSFGGYLAYLAAVDGGLGGFEVWFATASGFVVTLALSMLGPARRFVHVLAETMRWTIIAAIGVGGAWLAFHSWS